MFVTLKLFHLGPCPNLEIMVFLEPVVVRIVIVGYGEVFRETDAALLHSSGARTSEGIASRRH